uniref:DUF2878 domain-containing protein n=1 Tax=Thaumasiovibrio occultus TaxID=1891184 RepID=UPI000B363AC7|nr:DUF2878 domain-containing protein [Thaumasiovibrio occultus]
MSRSLILVSLLFNVFWALCVIGQERALWITLPALCVHSFLRAKSLPTVLGIMVLGITMDSLLIWQGVFVFATPWMPLWLGALWAGFGIFFWYLLPVISRFPAWQFVPVMAVAATGSYYAGFALEAVSLPLSLPSTLAVVFGCWCVFCTMLHWWSSFAAPDYISESKAHMD